MNAVWTIQHGESTIAEAGVMAARPSSPHRRVGRSNASSTSDATVAPVRSLTSRHATSGSRTVDEIGRAGRVEHLWREYRLDAAVAAERNDLLDQVTRLAGPQGT